MFKDVITDVFFDLDHTLWDFDRNSALTFKKILKENDVSVALEDFLEVYVPINLEFWKLYREEKISKAQLRYQRLKNTFDKVGASVSDEIIHVLADDYIAHLSSFTHLFPNTVEILEYLVPNYNLHIITNGFQEIQDKKLVGSNINKYFDQVINSEMAGVKKPNPYIFELAIQKAKVAPKNSLMIGDNLEADIMGARAVGMESIHFNAHSEPEHDLCLMISDLIEIKSFL